MLASVPGSLLDFVVIIKILLLTVSALVPNNLSCLVVRREHTRSVTAPANYSQITFGDKGTSYRSLCPLKSGTESP